MARVAAGVFGFLIFSHAFDGPDLYGASSFFETMPSRPTRGSKQFVAVKLLRDADPNSGVKRFCSAPSRNSLSEKDSDPTLQRYPSAHAGGLRHKSAFA